MFPTDLLTCLYLGSSSARAQFSPTQGTAPTEAAAASEAAALLRNNQPLLAYVAGKPDAFTSKDKNFTLGERLAKQAILINNSRTSVTATLSWSLGSLPPESRTFTLPTGEQARFPLEFTMPASPPGEASRQPRIRLQARFTPADPHSNLDGYDLLIVGNQALNLTNPAPDIRNVRRGLKVLVFEQTTDALHQRLGFRIQDCGLRRVFPRVPDHPALHGLEPDHLRDWRGSATLLPPQLDYTPHPRLGPTVLWCGQTVPHLWRASNRGNVASTRIDRFHSPLASNEPAPRWQQGLYIDTPVEWDDPYRFFRW